MRSEWYDNNWLKHETSTFNYWWLIEYGDFKKDFSQTQNECDEFYNRKAFALMGYLYGKSL